MDTTCRIAVEQRNLRGAFGFGVAGNFTGHLEQAGEAVDFRNVVAADALPKGIFPWYVPGSETFLGAFPVSCDTLVVPDPAQAPGRIQVEPELGVLCEVARDADGTVRSLTPRWIAAFDDCSLRRPNAARISQKKNWGAGSKGLAATAFRVANLDPDDALASLRLACFLRRDDETCAYGVDSALATYTLTGERLLEWLVDRLHNQRGSEDTPLEDVGALLAATPTATTALVGIGASRYEPFGETTFVEPGDEAIVVVYDADVHDNEDVAARIHARADHDLRAASVLRRLAIRS